MKHDAYFVTPTSIDEMLGVLINSRKDVGLFWTPMRKLNSTSYTYGTGRSYLFDTSNNLGLELKQFKWEDSYFPVGFGMALKMFSDSLRFKISRSALLNLNSELLDDKA